MKKILAILLAFAMLFAFAACGGNTEEETTTAPVAEETEAPAIEETEAPAIEETEAPTVDATVAEGETLAEGETAAPAAEMTKAEFVAFLNAETAKIAKSGSYNAKRDCSYTKKIDVGNATGALNSLISGIADGEDLDSVVGGFLGIGTKTAKMPGGDLDDDYQLKATAVTEADLGNFSVENGVYKFTLSNATDPKKTGATPISRFTNDFITHEEVVSSIAEFTSAITVENTKVNYKNINVEVTVVEGKITNIKYSYDFDAVLNLKLLVKIEGTGAAKTVGVYSDIKY